MDEPYTLARIIGTVPATLDLPGALVGRERAVRVSADRIGHIALRRPDWLAHCLRHAVAVLDDPNYLGWRPVHDRRRVEFVRAVGPDASFLLVAVKFLDDRSEAWVSTMHPMKRQYLTRRLRASTIWALVAGREDGKASVACVEIQRLSAWHGTRSTGRDLRVPSPCCFSAVQTSTALSRARRGVGG